MSTRLKQLCEWLSAKSTEWLDEHAGQMVAFHSVTDVHVGAGKELAALTADDKSGQYYLIGKVPGTPRFQRREHVEAKLELALQYLRSMCDKAESGNSCLLCGEDFNDSTPRSFPKCPTPSARDFLEDPDGLADAVVRAIKA